VRDDSLYVRHIAEAVDRILSYTSKGDAGFREDLDDAGRRGSQSPDHRRGTAHPEIP
jgi:hypothetical protein